MLSNLSRHRALDAYYSDLQNLAIAEAHHEGATSTAFYKLLDALGREHGWTLVREYSLDKRRRPDGAFKDSAQLLRGYWEAKDTQDDLNAEILKKLGRGYPQSNTIFEDTRRAVLWQNGREVGHFDLRDRAALSDLLHRFFTHTTEDIEAYHEAETQTAAKIPAIAARLQSLIHEEREANAAFAGAFHGLREECRASLNTGISDAQIEEMLVQHLLTERLFRTVFDDPAFVRRNLMASEIEKVIDALATTKAGLAAARHALDPYFAALERAARTIPDFEEKNTFLTHVYEKFFQDYSTAQADTHGIVYTPQPLVRWMVAATDDVLREEWNTSLAGEGVHVLDPCVGTGNFMVHILRHIAQTNKRDLPRKFKAELWANEILLLPYYVASLNIEREYSALTETNLAFPGLCFADTLAITKEKQTAMFTEPNTERIENEKAAEMMVIIGNPPYNAGQQNENDNNKNQAYPILDKRIRETYVKSSKATLNNKLYDPYVRFFRWASDRLNGRDGVVCFVTNNGFLNGIASDGMRKELAKDFNRIYHLDFKGNARTSGERRRQEGGNVFQDQIRVGVGVTLCVRSTRLNGCEVFYHAVEDYWKDDQKLEFVASLKGLNDVPWQKMHVDAKGNWSLQSLENDFETFLPLGSKDAKARKTGAEPTIFETYSLGVVTNRDAHAYEFNAGVLVSRARTFVDIYNGARDAAVRLPRSADAESVMDIHDSRIKWTRQVKASLRKFEESRFDENHIRTSLYRPFIMKSLYFDDFWIEERYRIPQFFPTIESERENKVICISGIGSNKPFHCLITDRIPCLDLLEKTQCFPLYVYDAGGTNRRENIADAAVEQFSAAVSTPVTREAIFHFIYASLHHPAYRARFAENLRRELPRVPLPSSAETFTILSEAGSKLAELHLGFEAAAEWPLEWRETSGTPFSWRIEKMRWNADKSTLLVNPSFSLSGFPGAAHNYKLGNRSALDWLVEGLQVKTDTARSGLVSDPNRANDPEYIARLIARVTRVSVETMQLVEHIASIEL